LLLNICMDDQQTPQITISDLAIAKNLISVACERGAFRAEEMTTVGELYDKLTQFLEHIVAAAESTQQGETK
jgi:hypothetical protein